MKLGSIYCIRDIDDKIIYVGQHWYKIEKGPNDKYMGSGYQLKKLYKKIGKSNFRKDVIISCLEKQEDMDRLETLFITELNTLYPNGYNMSLEPFGGKTSGSFVKGHKQPVETIEKMKLKRKDRKPNEGNKHSQESKDKISNSLTGKKRKPHTLESKKKMSESNKGQIPWNKGITGYKKKIN